MEDPRVARAVEMYQRGDYVQAIANEVRCSLSTLMAWLRNHHVPLRGNGCGPNHERFNRSPGEWDMDALIAAHEAYNAAIVANGCSSFPRPVCLT